MATYIVSKNRNRETGIIGLSTAVFESIASSCINEIANIDVAPSGTFQKSVVCKVVNKKIVLTLNVVLATGTNINDICTMVKEKIYNEIAYMTGFKDTVINMNVVGFAFK